MDSQQLIYTIIYTILSILSAIIINKIYPMEDGDEKTCRSVCASLLSPFTIIIIISYYIKISSIFIYSECQKFIKNIT